VHLIDFGLSERTDHLIEDQHTGFIGTRRYASRNAHLFKALSKRDDMISLGFVLVFMLKGPY
jgi:serine/threonine protein kinase